MTGAVGDAAAPRRGAFAPLRHRRFALCWTAWLVSNTGTWMQTITVPFVVDEITHSTTWVGLSAFATLFPVFIASPVAGPIADRFSRRRVLLWAQVLMLLAAVGLWALSATGTETRGLVLLLIAVSGIGVGFTYVTWQTLIPQLVPREDFLGAVRLSSTQQNAGRAIGPAIAGLVLDAFGPSTAFMINAVSFLGVIGVLAALPEQPRPRDESGTGFLAEFRAGIGYLRTSRPIMLVLVMFVAYSLLGSAIVQLAEPLARHALDAGAGGYGVIVAGFGVGAIFGSVGGLHLADRVTRSAMIAVGLVLYVVGQIVLGLAPVVWVAAGAMAVLGAAHVFIVFTITTTMQSNVTDAYRGRVMSLVITAGFFALPFGALLLAAVADVLGLRVVIVAAAGLLGVLMAILYARRGALRELDDSLVASDMAPIVPRAPGAPDLGSSEAAV